MGNTAWLQCEGFSLQWLLFLQNMGFRHLGFSSCGSWALEHKLIRLRFSCSMACGIFLDQGWNPCLLHGQADSWSLSHPGSLREAFLNISKPSNLALVSLSSWEFIFQTTSLLLSAKTLLWVLAAPLPPLRLPCQPNVGAGWPKAGGPWPAFSPSPLCFPGSPNGTQMEFNLSLFFCQLAGLPQMPPYFRQMLSHHSGNSLILFFPFSC